ncbi:MAG: PIG-L family deacetylase [Actinomycetota bacterium]|nr:PIG-L family deacetylase [Actinomycetota bacterium]
MGTYAALTNAAPPPRSLFDVVGPVRRALVVVAHPDDESFGLGALLAALAAQGAEVDLLCFTRGEASTLGATGHLADIRATELAAAGQELGLHHLALLEFGDGALALADGRRSTRESRPSSMASICW